MTYITGRDHLVYPIKTVNWFKTVLRECLDIEPEADLVQNDLYWAASSQEFLLRVTRTSSEKNVIQVGLGIYRTNADSQWNPFYKAFHQIHCCGNPDEMIRR